MSRRGNHSSPEGKYTQDILEKYTIAVLQQICRDLERELPDSRRKQPYIDLILSPNPPSGSGAASERSPSRSRSPSPSRSTPGGKVAHPDFIKISKGRKSPSPSKRRSASASAARGGDDPVDQLNDERERRVAEWKHVVGDDHPWKHLPTLQHIFNTKMMPLRPNIVATATPTLVILVGPAASGKSSALEMVGLGLTDDNTVRVDPDKIYEWLAHKYGYFPPEIKDIKDPKQSDDETREKYEERCVRNRARLTKQNDARLKWWIANKDTFDGPYGNEFKDDAPRRFEASEFCTPKTAGVLGQYRFVLPRMENMIFNGATAKGKESELNVLLDTTGGMEEGFLERMADRFKEARYKVVVVLVVSSVEDCISRVSGPGGRNTQQHRKLDEFAVGQIWRDFVDKETSCRWERFSHENKNEFVVVQNTWTRSREGGSARVVYRKDLDGNIERRVPPEELAGILSTYKVSTDADTGRFVCHGAAGSAASKRGRSHSHSRDHGGSSRKRRISRRRIHGSRYRKTIKKYARPVTRRRRRHHPRS